MFVEIYFPERGMQRDPEMKLQTNCASVQEVEDSLERNVGCCMEYLPLGRDVHWVHQVFLAYLIELPFQGVAGFDRTSEQALDLMELPALALRLHVVDWSNRPQWGLPQLPPAKAKEYVLMCRYAIVLIILRTNIEFPTNRNYLPASRISLHVFRRTAGVSGTC